MSLTPSRFFSPSEFACHDPDRTPYPEEWVDRWAAISSLCDQIREAWGRPLTVVSGYRTLSDNLALIDAVASGSFHLTGEAADLRPETGDEIPQLLALIVGKWYRGELPTLGGVGEYPVSCWVHVDLGKASDGHLRRWTGR